MLKCSEITLDVACCKLQYNARNVLLPTICSIVRFSKRLTCFIAMKCFR
jgi:hypothetical protein